jgi:hypothetical protein
MVTTVGLEGGLPGGGWFGAYVQGESALPEPQWLYQWYPEFLQHSRNHSGYEDNDPTRSDTTAQLDFDRAGNLPVDRFADHGREARHYCGIVTLGSCTDKAQYRRHLG